jgi:pimeloyl-ACP methyl ester carboxylesterase
MLRLWSASYGSGKPLIMIHGMGSASTAWRQITPRLAEQFRVVHIDLPGHGFSPLESHKGMDPHSLAERVLEEIDALKIENFHLVGNSLGGWIVLDLASEHADRVLSVTGVAPAGLWLSPVNRRRPIGAYARTLAQFTYPLAPLFMRYEWARKIGFLEVSPLWKELPQQTILDAVKAMGTSAGYYPAWDSLLMLRFDKPVEPKIPVTIIFGDADKTLPANTSQERSLAPLHAEWIRIEKSGHAPMWDHPDEVVNIIVNTTAKAQS